MGFGNRAGAAHWLLLAGGMVLAQGARAGSFELFGLEAQYQLIGSYALGVRTESPDGGIINTPPSPRIPIPDYLKLPESNNFDDGDRNFKKGALINNRLTVLGEFQFQKDDYGMLLRGDAFYDDVYRRLDNDNDLPETINTTQQPVNTFTDAARYFDGRRTRLLDAYVYGSWAISDSSTLNLRLGQQVVAWGESLFFSGVALAQGPADATKANVPGADVKSILLPVNQIALQLTVTDDITLLGQYKLEYKETELNPVGEFFSIADVVGPGAEFIYGIQNPLFLGNYADVNLLSDDVPEALQLVVDLIAPELPTEQLTGALAGLLGGLDGTLPDVNLPVGAIAQPGVPRNINVQRGPDIRPSDFGQWGLGVRYRLTNETNIGLYRLRYHNTTPAPVQNYGDGVLIPGNGVLPPVTTALLGLQIPVTYNIRYFDGIDLTALSFSSTLFGANIAGELIYREGVDTLVDVDGGLLGPVPTPTRSKIAQLLLSAIYVLGPSPAWDAVTIVGEAGYVHVREVDEACGPTSCSKDLTYDANAWGVSILSFVDYRNVFSGWDLQIPISFSGIAQGQSSLLGGLGALSGEGDLRASLGASFTRLQKLTLGVNYSAFFGEPNFRQRPYADRDNASISVTYRF